VNIAIHIKRNGFFFFPFGHALTYVFVFLASGYMHSEGDSTNHLSDTTCEKCTKCSKCNGKGFITKPSDDSPSTNTISPTTKQQASRKKYEFSGLMEALTQGKVEGKSADNNKMSSDTDESLLGSHEPLSNFISNTQNGAN
jgi:hypothetical protein